MKLQEALNILDNELEIDENNVCLIGKENIEYKITLPCNHSFDYVNLFRELLSQHKHLYGLGLNNKYCKTINKCPYCRTIYDKSIPYYDISGVYKVKGVNYDK